MHQHRIGVLYTAYRLDAQATSILAHNQVPVKRGLFRKMHSCRKPSEERSIRKACRSLTYPCSRLADAVAYHQLIFHHLASPKCDMRYRRGRRLSSLAGRKAKPGESRSPPSQPRPARHAPIKRFSASYAHLAIQHAQTPISMIGDKRTRFLEAVEGKATTHST